MHKLSKQILKFDKKLDSKPLLVTAGTLAICLLIVVLRKPQAFTHAQFWAEDGVIWFAQAYNWGFWHTIAQPYSGTFSVLTRTVGYLASLAPLKYAPLFFSLAALAVQLLPVFIVCSTRLKNVVRYRYVAILASLLYVCITNSAEVFVNLANIQWHLGIAAFLVLIASKPKSRAWQWFDVVVLGLTGLTGPLGIILVIIAAVMWYRNRGRQALLNLGILAVTALCQIVSLFILTPGQRGGSMGISWISIAKMISGQIFTASILSEHHTTIFYGSFLLYVVLGLGLLIMLYAVVKGPSWLRYANLYAVLLYVFMLASLKPLQGVDVWGILTHTSTGQRYWYIPIFVWLVTLLWVVLAAKNRLMRLTCGALLVLFVCVGVPGSWSIPPQPDQHYQTYVERFNNRPAGQAFAIPVNPTPWKMVLIKR